MPSVKEPTPPAAVLPPSPSQHHQQQQQQQRLPKRGRSPTTSSDRRARAHDKIIIDIRLSFVEEGLRDQVVACMNPKQGPRTLPTLLLYDAKGLQLFEEITYLDEYYLTNDEIEILENGSRDIAMTIPEHSMIIELGSGNLRKTCLLLQAFEDLHKNVEYFALDLSLPELDRTLSELPEFTFVKCHGLRGTYDDGREWLKRPAFQSRPKCVMQLGSSIGNFSRTEAAEFLEGFAQVLKPKDLILIGIDACDNAEKVYQAYNDSEGTTHRFILNGLEHANRLFQDEIFRILDWRVIGEYVYDQDGGRHQAFVSPRRKTSALGITLSPHDRIKIEQSLKYSQLGINKLIQAGGLEEVNCWTTDKQYGLHLLRKAPLPLCRLPSLYAAAPLPSLSDWSGLWEAWGHVTQVMLPDSALLDKPISLRNPYIFYLGHIPTFLDLQLSKVSGHQDPQLEQFQTIFERGIDPDVDNPELCHQHSEIPDQWPHPEDIHEYQFQVRHRLLSLYPTIRNAANAEWMRRAIWTSFEHEVMHLETLLYMILQSTNTNPPLITTQPDWEEMAMKAREEAVPNEWFTIPEQTITVGLDDPEGNGQGSFFGWDNEKPARQVHVPSFRAKGRAITVLEYCMYLSSQGHDDIPASWERIHVSPHLRNLEGKLHGVPLGFFINKAVKTVFGLIPIRQALDWPVIASYDELADCAAWMGGRIPTADEARSIYTHVERQKQRDDALRSMLSALGPGADDGYANVGFRNWHPLPVSSHGNKLAGHAGLGGVWEWTSTAFDAHEGFEPMQLYPQYSQDFFDGKHNVVLGGSWATHPRVAGRRSFVNWYQRNYRYAWAGARLVKDV